MTEKGKPESGKLYKLTAGTGEACIMAGNTWAESEVKTLEIGDKVKEDLLEIPEFLKRSE
jgi:hypothetical protein